MGAQVLGRGKAPAGNTQQISWREGLVGQPFADLQQQPPPPALPMGSSLGMWGALLASPCQALWGLLLSWASTAELSATRRAEAAASPPPRTTPARPPWCPLGVDRDPWVGKQGGAYPASGSQKSFWASPRETPFSPPPHVLWWVRPVISGPRWGCL